MATPSGKYFVHYHTPRPGTCGREASTALSLTPSPRAYLGKDTIVCQGKQTLLRPISPAGIATYLWSTGSAAPSLSVDQPGTYYLKAANECGVSLDTVLVQEATLPKLRLSEDTLLCPGTTLTLQNRQAKQPWDTYLWSTGSSLERLPINQAGTYWLQSTSACGGLRDSVVVQMKDSCRSFNPHSRFGPRPWMATLGCVKRRCFSRPAEGLRQ